MKIAHIIDRMVVGGAENLLANVILGIQDQHPDIEQYLFTLEAGDAYVEQLSCLKSFEVLDINVKNICFKIKAVQKKFELLEIDVIHAHLYKSTIVSRLLKPRNTKLISTVHSGYHEPGSMGYSKKRLILDKMTYKPEYHTVFISESTRDQYFNGYLLRDNVHVVHNFSSKDFTANYQFNDKKGLKLIAVGRLEGQKNYIYLLETLNKIKELDIELDIYGEGPLKKMLKEFLETNNMSNVFLKGRKALKSSDFSQYDAYIMASHFEGMSIALLEAMSSGLPVILSEIPSFKLVAENEAIFFDISNSDSLVEVLTNLTLDKPILIGHSRKSLERAKDFSEKRHVDKLIKIYF